MLKQQKHTPLIMPLLCINMQSYLFGDFSIISMMQQSPLTAKEAPIEFQSSAATRKRNKSKSLRRGNFSRLMISPPRAPNK
jgi:hypothetical protein